MNKAVIFLIIGAVFLPVLSYCQLEIERNSVTFPTSIGNEGNKLNWTLTGRGVLNSETSFFELRGIRTSGSTTSFDYPLRIERNSDNQYNFTIGPGSLQIDGTSSPYGFGTDDSVIRSDQNQDGSDMIIVSNDAIAFFLDDDDNNSNSKFEIWNGAAGLGGGTRVFEVNESGEVKALGSITAMSLSGSSDINRKELFENVDEASILTKLADLPITTWQYKTEGVTHIGPMAQDFYAAFELGANDTSITTVDADGIAFAAIKALKDENDKLTLLVDQLVTRIEALEKSSSHKK